MPQLDSTPDAFTNNSIRSPQGNRKILTVRLARFEALAIDF
jgi:hypothetical protein